MHLKSLYDGHYQKDVAEQNSELDAVLDWVGDSPKVIICGDFNNVPGSSPIKKMQDAHYTNILDSTKYLSNITGNKYTEFHGKHSKESGSIIDYIFTNLEDNLVSSHIVNYQRETNHQIQGLRGESSDHLPVLGIFKL